MNLKTESPLIDTHCHLNMLDENQDATLTHLASAYREGVEALVQIGIDLPSARFSRDTGDLLETLCGSNPYPDYFWSAALHPESVSESSTFKELESFIIANYNSKKFLAIGETGLDYFHNPESRKEQILLFRKHIELASSLDLPLILHLRDTRSYDPNHIQAARDAIDLILEYNNSFHQTHANLRGVLHCYTYSIREALPFLDLGWMISFSGIVTYRNAKVIQDAAVKVPIESLLVETDAPFLSPVPKRGEANRPEYVRHTRDFIVGLRSSTLHEDQEHIARTIHDNGKKFLSWKIKV